MPTHSFIRAAHTQPLHPMPDSILPSKWAAYRAITSAVELANGPCRWHWHATWSNALYLGGTCLLAGLDSNLVVHKPVSALDPTRVGRLLPLNLARPPSVPLSHPRASLPSRHTVPNMHRVLVHQMEQTPTRSSFIRPCRVPAPLSRSRVSIMAVLPRTCRLLVLTWTLCST